MIEQCKELKPLPGSKSKELLGNPDRGFRYEFAVHVAEDEQEYGISDCNTSAIERAKEQFELYKDDRPQMAQVYVYMHSYMERDLDEAAFKAMRRYFDLLKEKKIRMLLRFAYQRDKIEWAKGDVDPHLNQVLRHIDQLKPLIEQYKDNIYAVQAGFVGIWGEWHSMINLSKEDCKIILEKLIDALPPELFVQIRYMWIKNMLRVDDPRRLRVGYHDDYVMDRPISWSSAANETEWAVETAEAPYLVNDAEMPWGNDEEFMGPLMNPIPLMQRMYRHCFSTLSIRHNYIERGCEYDMQTWKRYPATPQLIHCADMPAPHAWFRNENGEPIYRSMFEYIRDFTGYYIAAEKAELTEEYGGLRVDVSLKNYGTAAPITMRDPEAVIADEKGNILASRVLCRAAEMFTNKTVNASVFLKPECLPKGAVIGVRFVNPMNTPAKLATDIPFENGINILGRIS